MGTPESIDSAEVMVKEAIIAPGIVIGLPELETFIIDVPESVDVDVERQKYVDSAGRVSFRGEGDTLEHTTTTFMGWLERLGVKVIFEEMDAPYVY